MILEYAESGTLYDKIKMNSVSKQEIKRYFKDVCEGLAYLHGQNIMHRDIKVFNIQLSPKTSYSRKAMKPNYVTSASQPSLENARPYAAPMSTCRLK